MRLKIEEKERGWVCSSGSSRGKVVENVVLSKWKSKKITNQEIELEGGVDFRFFLYSTFIFIRVSMQR